MVTKSVPTVEGISCAQHSGACLPIIFILYYWALSVACTGCCCPSSLRCGHAVTPLQDLSKHMLEGLPVDASLGFWSCPHICLLR